MEKLEQKYYYLNSSLIFEKVSDFTLDERQLKSIIIHSLQTLHGQVGAAIQVDVIRFESHAQKVTATLRVANRNLVKLWSALSLLGNYGNRLCAFQITKISASLMGLAVESRNFNYVQTNS